MPGGWKLDMPDDNNSFVGEPRVDKDRDGMADDWETQHGGDLELGGHDLHKIPDNIEIYLNDLADELVKQIQPIAVHKAVVEAGRGLKRP